MAANCHTHQICGGMELVSASTLTPALTSLEFHPWQVPDDFVSLPLKFLDLAPRVAALGECGLDRLKGAPLASQLRALEAIVELAEKLHKPLVIHSVRCDSELFACLKGFGGNVLFHGFCHAPRRLDALLEKGFFVSLAPYAWRETKLAERLKRDDFSHIGFETDDTGFAIDAVVADAARELAISDLDARSCVLFSAFIQNKAACIDL